MSNIFKINYIKNNKSKNEDKRNIKEKSIYVFSGDLFKDLDPNKSFKENPNSEIFSPIFTSSEISYITESKINVIFSNQEIHLDDTIETIKKKIILELDYSISFDEIYLFSQKELFLSYDDLISYVSVNNILSLNKSRILTLISNLNNPSLLEYIDLDDEKDSYNPQELNKLFTNIQNHSQILNIPLGQEIKMQNTNYPFIVNPYDVSYFDTFL